MQNVCHVIQSDKNWGSFIIYFISPKEKIMDESIPPSSPSMQAFTWEPYIVLTFLGSLEIWLMRSSTSLWKVSSGKTSVTRPQSQAVRAEICRPNSNISLAWKFISFIATATSRKMKCWNYPRELLLLAFLV